MSVPIIKKIVPFDANKEYEISISWNGNRAYANRIIIMNSKTLEVVFDDTTPFPSFSLTHKIPAHQLLNGKEYIIQAQIFDQKNTPSLLSSKTNFYTLKTPDNYQYFPNHVRSST